MSTLPMWTIYERPSDYPRHFVVRKWLIGPAGGLGAEPDAHLADTLEEARALIPDGLVRLPRDDDDDATIVESWL